MEIRRALLIVIAVLLIPLCCFAAPTGLSSFDIVDDSAGTAKDFFDWDCTTLTATDTTALAVTMGSGNYTHNSENGGDSSSKYALKVATTTTGSAVCIRAGLNETTLTSAVAIHLNATPTAARTVLSHIQGSNYGASVKVDDTDSSLSVWYGNESTVLIISGEILRQKACWSTTDKESRTPCTSSADCLSGYTCGNGSSVCSSTDGAGCYLGIAELTEEHLGLAVRVTLRVNGRLVGTKNFTPATAPSNITSVWLGSFCGAALGLCSGGESGNFTAFFDSYADDSGTRAYSGYNGFLTPANNGLTGENGMSSNGCSGGHFPCVDDYVSGGAYEESSYLSTSAVGRTEAFNVWTPDITVPSTIRSIPALEYFIVGRATGSGTRNWSSQGRLCDTTDDPCLAISTSLPEVGFSISDVTTSRLFQRVLLQDAPDGEEWTSDRLARWALKIQSESGTNAVGRMAALGTTFRVTRDDAPERVYLKSHTLGADQQCVAIAHKGDSNVSATSGGTCSGGTEQGEQCTALQATYCSYDPIERDTPSGGCTTNASCYRCAGNQSINGGVGAPCDGPEDCPVDGNCDEPTNSCVDNPAIYCENDSQCDNFGGACDTSATCEPMCAGGGSCTGTSGWPPLFGELVSADYNLMCGVGGTTSTEQLIDFDLLLEGRDPRCSFDVGAGSCICQANGDCPGGGTCLDTGGGACTAGETCTCSGGDTCIQRTDCKECVTNADCGPEDRCHEGHCACASPCRPSIITVSAGGNNAARIASPNCSEPDPSTDTAHNLGICAEATPEVCVKDADCPTNSFCLGRKLAVQATWCNDAEGSGDCSMRRSACNDNSDCLDFNRGGGPQTCSKLPTCTGESTTGDCTDVKDGTCDGTNGITCSCDSQCHIDGVMTGWCTPGADNLKCPAGGYVAYHGVCMKSCTSHANCRKGGNTTSLCNIAEGVCEGTCALNCDRTSCDSDDDCPLQEVITTSQHLKAKGYCDKTIGKCKECGLISFDDTGFTHAASNFRHSVDMTVYRDFVAIQDYIDSLVETDGRPIVLFTTIPRFRQMTHGGVHWMSPWSPVRESAALLNNPAHIPHVVDVREVMAQHSDTQTYVPLDLGGRFDGVAIAVHVSDPDAPETVDISGQEVFASTIANYINSLNMCAVGKCVAPGMPYGGDCGSDSDCSAPATCQFRGLPRPQKYCRAANGTWRTAKCDDITPCATVGDSCQLRPCACKCHVDNDCENLFGPGNVCVESSNNACDADDTSCYCELDALNVDSCGVPFASHTCDLTDGRCELGGNDACPGTFDSCRVE